jgi:RNA polymerase sigma-70 factor, ECF subfamily
VLSIQRFARLLLRSDAPPAAPLPRGCLTSLGSTEFRALFDAERQPLLRFLCHLTGNANDAEDLLQETFLAVWRKRDQFQGRGSAGGYLRRTAFNLFLNTRQKSARRGAESSIERVEPACAPAAELEVDEARAHLARRIHAAVDTLPDGPREAFILFRFEGHTCAEIAEITGVPHKTIESRLARAVELLAPRLRPHAEEFRS